MKPTIAIFRHDPIASQDCVDGMIEALSGEFAITLFDEGQLANDPLRNADIVAFPGGAGNAYYRFFDCFKRRETNEIADFVARGGKYLGICMGAYWAGRNYFDLLDGLEPVQYIKTPGADVKRSYPTTAAVTWGERNERMYFYDGPTFVGSGRCQQHARYATGAPMAIIQKRVGLIGCHPESTASWFERKYLQKHWHGGAHHELLLRFTKKLFRQK
jgi:GMP synthase-like glutamine amidotransferase